MEMISFREFDIIIYEKNSTTIFSDLHMHVLQEF